MDGWCILYTYIHAYIHTYTHVYVMHTYTYTTWMGSKFYTYTYIHTYIHVYVHTHTHTRREWVTNSTYIRTRMYTHITHACIYMHTCMCTHITHACIRMYTRMYTHIHAYTHACIHAIMHVYMAWEYLHKYRCVRKHTYPWHYVCLCTCVCLCMCVCVCLCVHVCACVCVCVLYSKCMCVFCMNSCVRLVNVCVYAVCMYAYMCSIHKYSFQIVYQCICAYMHVCIHASLVWEYVVHFHVCMAKHDSLCGCNIMHRYASMHSPVRSMENNTRNSYVYAHPCQLHRMGTCINSSWTLNSWFMMMFSSCKYQWYNWFFVPGCHQIQQNKRHGRGIRLTSQWVHLHLQQCVLSLHEIQHLLYGCQGSVRLGFSHIITEYLRPVGR